MVSWQERLHWHLYGAQAPLVVVLGPTASGKTDFSLEIAEELIRTEPDHDWRGAEIVNADSRQLYRGLDIGTAKIRSQQMRSIPHHLLSVLDPSEEVTIAWYKEQAIKIVDCILKRKAVPILVGGSMLYISSIIDGLEPPPPADLLLRRRLEEEYGCDGGVSVYRRLQELDPDAALAIHRHNQTYVIRALEIAEATGKPKSQQQKTSVVPYDLLNFGLRWQRTVLVGRINERTRKLLDGGWVEEVWSLLQGGYGPDAPAMKSHGYREILAAFSFQDVTSHVGDHVPFTGLSASKTINTAVLQEIARDQRLYEAIAAKTRQYAKRQMTWWRHDSRINWIDMQ